MPPVSKINYNHLPIDNLPIGNQAEGNSRKVEKLELPIGAVDKVRDELVSEYRNPDFKAWYCGVIYEFGFEKVEEWRRRASEGKEPAKLFSMYVKHARTYHSLNQKPIAVAYEADSGHEEPVDLDDIPMPEKPDVVIEDIGDEPINLDDLPF
jgi:hypothetical protein